MEACYPELRMTLEECVSVGVKALALDVQCSSGKAGGGWREGMARLAGALQSLDLTVDTRQPGCTSQKDAFGDSLEKNFKVR